MSHLALIVEDEPALRLIYETVLHDLGFQVMHAADGDEAIKLLADFSPNIVFLDMLLPKIDGSQVLKYIQDSPHLRDTSTVVVTAHSRFQTMISLSPNDLFLLKPVRPRDIRLAVDQVLAAY